MPPKAKTPKESTVSMTEMVMPNDTNPLNNLMGGRIMHLLDVAAAIAAQRHCNRVVVTASVDNVLFENSLPLGGVLTIDAKVTRAFNSSMEVYVKATGEHLIQDCKKFTVSKAFLTFVAVDQMGKPIPVPEVIPETDAEKSLYDTALQRRELRLVLAGKMKVADAKALQIALNAAEISKEQ